MKLFKYFSFWLTLFALSICLFNSSGFDDKNLLLYITSPILWFLDDFSPFLKRFISEQILIGLFYFLSLFFWCCIGLLIDTFIHPSKRKILLLCLSRIGVASCLIILISAVFYTAQNTEKQISNILKNPNKYNEQSVRIAVVKSAKDGYGEKYIVEMATILQTTNNKEIYGSTIYALGIIGTTSAVKALMEHYNDPEDIMFVLKTNENTIISMLDKNQPLSTITTGIEATKLLGFESFINPLSNIINEYPNKEIQKKATEALEQISQSPKKNNPKFNID
ncbi:hypothetical protein [Paenibacillus sp. sgz302251]|uniref:hypothetical protein n=1 Tax=Paenibacillus sp. sgz302251 TaxID=3414493 RepID=UPI003C7E0A1F